MATPAVTVGGAQILNAAVSRPVVVRTVDLGPRIVAYAAQFAGRP
jgi:hypothetical protein